MNERPILMQLAEPEYMCPKCGFKFYLVLNEDGTIKTYPTHCTYCGEKFDWDGLMLKGENNVRV